MLMCIIGLALYGGAIDDCIAHGTARNVTNVTKSEGVITVTTLMTNLTRFELSGVKISMNPDRAGFSREVQHIGRGGICHASICMLDELGSHVRCSIYLALCLAYASHHDCSIHLAPSTPPLQSCSSDARWIAFAIPLVTVLYDCVLCNGLQWVTVTGEGCWRGIGCRGSVNQGMATPMCTVSIIITVVALVAQG